VTCANVLRETRGEVQPAWEQVATLAGESMIRDETDPPPEFLIRRRHDDTLNPPHGGKPVKRFCKSKRLWWVLVSPHRRRDSNAAQTRTSLGLPMSPPTDATPSTPLGSSPPLEPLFHLRDDRYALLCLTHVCNYWHHVLGTLGAEICPLPELCGRFACLWIW
jgi:hypothetical protein